MAFGFLKKKTYADSVFRGGIVRTLDAETEGATAVACKDGKVMQIGTDAMMEALIGPDTKVVELNGRVLVPGFIDLSASFSEQIMEGHYLRLQEHMSAREVAQALEHWAKTHEPCEFILAFGWFSAEESLPEISRACPGIPVLLVGADNVGIRINDTALEMVKARLEESPFAVTVSPAFLFNTIVSMDFTQLGEKALELAYSYAQRGYTSLLNLEICTFFDNICRNLLTELYQAGGLRQRYYGSYPLSTMQTPLSVMHNLDRRRTDCSEMEGFVNFNTLYLTASSKEKDAAHMSEKYLKELCGAAADKGYSIRIDALDKSMALTAMEILGNLSTAYRKAAFTVACDETIREDEKADIYCGDVFECPRTTPLPLSGKGEELLIQRTDGAALRLGQRQLGSIVEGKSADFAIFSVDPTTSTTPEDFDALRADMTVLAGIPVYDSSSSQTPKDWYEEFSSQVEQVFGELSFEEGEE